MANNEKAGDWIKIKEQTPLVEFLRQHRNAFLLQTPTEDSSDFGDGQNEFATSVMDLNDVLYQKRVGLLASASVYPVVKAPGNPYPDRVSVGRAQNCDIVIKDPSISKLHAHFAMLSENGARLRDASSANGTRVSGRSLEAGKLQAITSGDTIMFGAVTVQFLSPRSFYAILSGSSS